MGLDMVENEITKRVRRDSLARSGGRPPSATFASGVAHSHGCPSQAAGGPKNLKLCKNPMVIYQRTLFRCGLRPNLEPDIRSVGLAVSNGTEPRHSRSRSSTPPSEESKTRFGASRTK